MKNLVLKLIYFPFRMYLIVVIYIRVHLYVHHMCILLHHMYIWCNIMSAMNVVNMFLCFRVDISDLLVFLSSSLSFLGIFSVERLPHLFTCHSIMCIVALLCIFTECLTWLLVAFSPFWHNLSSLHCKSEKIISFIETLPIHYHIRMLLWGWRAPITSLHRLIFWWSLASVRLICSCA